MITINNLKELEKYKIKSEEINQNDIKNYYIYKFKENGKLADVTFNIEIPFGVSDLGKLIKEDEDILDSEFEDVDCYEFVAKNVYANKNLRLGSLIAKSLIFKDSCEVQFHLDIKNKIQGANLCCEFLPVICKDIDCDKIEAESIMCKTLKAKTLVIKHNYFENIHAENVNDYNEMPR